MPRDNANPQLEPTQKIEAKSTLGDEIAEAIEHHADGLTTFGEFLRIISDAMDKYLVAIGKL